MKKTVVTALIALLIMLAFATCDSFITEPGTGSEKAEYTADGRQLVTVSVDINGVAGSRSLISSITQSLGGADYYEVIFKTEVTATPGTYTYQRAANQYALSVKIKIPEGDYGEEDAIVLIGKKESNVYTLLATGVILKAVEKDGTTEHTITNPADTIPITTDTASITFTVKALEANISPSGSAFVFNESAGSPILGTDFAGETTNGIYENDRHFQLPADKSNIQATLTISNFDKTGDFIVRTSASSPVTFPGVGAGTPVITDTTIPPGIGTAIGNDGKINIEFTTPVIPPNAAARYQIIFNIPVVGYDIYNSGTSKPVGLADQIPWSIRGGIVSNLSDYNGTTGNEGIPLIVANDPLNGVDLIFVWEN